MGASGPVNGLPSAKHLRSSDSTLALSTSEVTDSKP